MAPTEAAKGPDFIEALAKGLQVLAAFERDTALNNGKLAEITGLPKATVSRLTGTLVALGYLQRDEESREYVIGSRMLGLGANVQRHMRLQRLARPLMHELADLLDASIVLGTRDGMQILLVEIARPPRSQLTVNSEIGSHLPLATSSIGMSCLVATPVRDRMRLLKELQRLHPDNWMALRERVERAHAERERQRFVVSLHSRGGTLSAAATPLVLEPGRVFSLAAAGPSAELPRTRLLKVVGPALADLVDRIARDLGGSPATTTSPARVPRRTARC